MENKVAQASASQQPAGSPEAPLSARACPRLPQAPASLGQPAAWAVLAGHMGLVFHIGEDLCRALSGCCHMLKGNARAA